MALIADDVSRGAAPPFPFALEAELRPLEGLIARLRRADRVEEARRALQAAAQRIESLALKAGRVDVADLAGALDAYFGHGELVGSDDPFDDARFVCAVVDLIHAKLPGDFDRTEVADLEAFVGDKVQARAEAAIAKSQMPVSLAVDPPSAEAAPWSAVDTAIDRGYAAGYSDPDLALELPQPPAQLTGEPPQAADELGRMLAEAFPEIEAADGTAEEAPAPPDAESTAEEPAAEGDELARMLAEAFPEATKPPEVAAEAAAEIGETPTTEAGAPAVEAVELPTVEVDLPADEPAGLAAEVAEATAADAVEIGEAEVPPAEDVPEAVPRSKRRRNGKGQFTPSQDKRARRERRGKKTEVPAAEVANTSPIEVAQPAPVEAAEPAQEQAGEMLKPDGLNVPPFETPNAEAAALAPLAGLRASLDAVASNPADADALLDLAAAFDEYQAAAVKAGQVPAADLAAKLGELPWQLAEQGRAATAEEVELLRRGLQALADFAAEDHDAEQTASPAAVIGAHPDAPDGEQPFGVSARPPAGEVAEERRPEPPPTVDYFPVRSTAPAGPFEEAEDAQAGGWESEAEAIEPEAKPEVFTGHDTVPLAEDFVHETAADAPRQAGRSGPINLLALYEKEAAELVATFERSLAALAEDPANADALNDAFMTAHTYVGAAATVGFTDCSRVAGHLESVLERILTGTAVWDTDAHGLLAFGAELLRRRSVRDSLSPFLVAGFSERCARWAAGQDARLAPPTPETAPAADAEAKPPLWLMETQPFHPNDERRVTGTDAADGEVTEVIEADVPPAKGAAFDLFAGVTEAELEVADVPAELLEVYTEEAEEHLRIINAGLDRLRGEPGNRELVQEVRRSAHTLKGAAGAVGLRAVAKLAHRMEDLLDQLYEGARTVEPHVYALLRRSNDLLGELSTGAQNPGSYKDALNDVLRQYAAVVAEVKEAAPSAEEGPGESEPPVCTAPPSGERPEAPEPEPAAPVASVPTPVPIVTTGPVEAPAWPAAPAWNKPRTAHEQGQARRGGHMLRVPIERIDELVRLVSELVINRTAFEQRMADFVRLVEDLKGSSSRLRTTSVELQNEYEATAHRTGRRALAGADAAGLSTTGDGRFATDFDALEFDRYTEFHLLTRALAESTGDVGTLSGELANLVGDFDALLNRQSRLSRAIQDRLMRTRMVALSSLASRLERTVRSAADALGKRVDLELRGDATELDKTVLEEMIDPLLHLLRNCVDHGLEPEAERLAAGKPAAGRIFVHAFHQGTQVVIQVGDDGRGIDPEKLRAAAVRHGFLQPGDAAEADVEALHQLLFAPGFSTAGEVSEISGRGVGLDVVRSRVAKLKGSIAVDSAAGKGTTFSIRLPMTLAIARSLLVSAHGKTFAIPIQAVAQIVRVERADVGRVADGRVIFHGGKVFSLFQLGKTLGLPAVREEEPAVMPVLITHAGARQVAVQVDKIVAAREVVVKTLGTHLRRVHGMIGATLLGDGTVVPILNLPELYAKARAEAAGPTARPALAKASGGLQVMVVDDSVSVRRVVSTMIKGQGWTPLQAKDGLDALEQLQKSPARPDAILLDVEMPRMSGYELLAALRSQEKFRGVPVVMVTSRSGDKHRRKAMELGASEYTVKPFLEDALVALLRRLTGAAAKA